MHLVTIPFFLYFFLFIPPNLGFRRNLFQRSRAQTKMFFVKHLPNLHSIPSSSIHGKSHSITHENTLTFRYLQLLLYHGTPLSIPSFLKHSHIPQQPFWDKIMYCYSNCGSRFAHYKTPIWRRWLVGSVRSFTARRERAWGHLRGVLPRRG